jgi:ankyrin repeat protein
MRMNRIWIITLILTLYLLLGKPQATGTQSQESGISASYDSVLQELPACSWLRKDLAENSPAIEQSYMAAMRRAGVKRVFLEASLIWKHGKPTQIQIYRRLFFSAFDGPDAEIINAEKSQRLEAGIDPVVDSVATDRIMNAHLFGGLEGRAIRHPEGKRMYAYVEFLSTPLLKERGTRILPWGEVNPLIHAAYIGDVTTVKAHTKIGDKAKLNEALLQSVLNPYDNAQVIQWLVKHGADPNYHGSDGITPLINAVAHPCNVEALLRTGARLNETDKWGRTALKVAIEGKQDISARILSTQSSTTPN